jgi:hypothetical protein
MEAGIEAAAAVADEALAGVDGLAPIDSPTFTGTVSGIDATMVGLDAVNNTADLDKPVSTAAATQLASKAPLASPTFTGTVTVSTISGVTKSMVGLGNVDNTSDANKPISTATQTALDAKAASSHTHVATTALTATGTKDNTTFLRGDDTWAVPPGDGSGGGGIVEIDYDDLPVGSVLYVVQNGDETWPNRLTDREDVLTVWVRIVVDSDDPAIATPPALNGAYENDVVIGA